MNEAIPQQELATGRKLSGGRNLRKSFAVLCCITARAFLAGVSYLWTDTTLRNGWLVATVCTAGLILVALYLFLTRRD